VYAEATVKVEVGGLDALIDGLESEIAGIVEKYATLIVETARRYAPVATGALRASIHATLEAFAATISAGEGLPDARAIFMEFGFHHHGSGVFVQRPFFRQAVEQYAAAFVREIAQLFRG
jgi:hypothetical protein